MKRLILCIAVVSMLAATAAVSVAGAQSVSSDALTDSDSPTTRVKRAPTPSEDGPVRPVPEPGTMALATMGLVALGAAVRKQRTR